jgi:putative SOS response-associated peptidase YedK
MCGRYTLKKSRLDLEEHFGLPVPETMRFNIAPSQRVPAITLDAVKLLTWGFVPSWSKEPKVKFSNINARCETVATSAAYRGSFRRKRCLLPGDGFFEWAVGPPKVPHHFKLKDGGLFAFAGLWDEWGDELETCALITTTANEVVGPVHGRMPVMLLKEDYQTWLDPDATEAELLGLLSPLPCDLMEGYAVGPAVNRPSNDGPECVQPV